MRHLIPLFFISVLSACTTVEPIKPNVPIASSVESAVVKKPKVELSASDSSLSNYLRDYLSKNISDRAQNSRSLIDRSGIESNGRLPSTSLFQSLGYRMRDAFVAMPPELNSRNFKDAEGDLYPKLIHGLEKTWALLDSTRARLKSQGGLEAGREDWEVAVARRNLILEAISYWYQLRNQEDHSQWLIRLGDRSNELYKEISEARQNYDVKDQHEHEFVLLNLRADVASLFQFYSSEQARLYNRIGERALPPRRSDEQPKFDQKLQCQAVKRFDEKGIAYLNRYYRKRLETILSGNYKTSAYELNVLAREVASQALEIHSSRIKGIEQPYIIERAKAQKRRDAEIEKIERRQRALIEIGQVDAAQKLEELKTAPLDAARASVKPTEAEQLLYSAITVLSNIAAEKLLEVNQSRLNDLLKDMNQIYQVGRNQIWKGTTKETRVLHNLFLDIYDHSLVDYLLGYERLSFINQAILHGCDIDSTINSRAIGFDPKSIDDIAELVESHYANNFASRKLKERLNEYVTLSNAFSSSVIGQGYQVESFQDSETGETISGFEFNSNKGEALLVSAKQQEYNRINQSFLEQGLKLASRDDVLAFAQGRGYTLQIAETESLSEASDLIKRYASNGDGLVYRSQEQTTKRVLLKVVIGKELNYDAIVSKQKQLNLGIVKSFSEVRSEAYDE